MSLQVGSIVLTVADVPTAMAFWAAALDLEPREGPEPDWVVLRPRSGLGPNLSLSQGESRPAYFPHVHLDLYTADQVGEVERLLDLGARRVKDWPYPLGEHDFVVLEDPDGNRFCIVDTDGA
jgi:catechol 2,3-dioxygenase-like lactoylglutathione lyase family enzyme